MKVWRRWLNSFHRKKPAPSLPPRPEDAEMLELKFAALRAGIYRPRNGFLDEKPTTKK